jgi:hypothetical protein
LSIGRPPPEKAFKIGPFQGMMPLSDGIKLFEIMNTSTIAFINQWQTLIGSALGPFLAIIFSILGYYAKSKYEESKQIDDNIRTVDTAIVRTLNDLYASRLLLEQFTQRLRMIVRNNQAISDNQTYVSNETNFPSAGEVFRDLTLPTLKFGSNYLHNQLMFFDAGLQKTNTQLKDMKESFAAMLGKNEFSIARNQPATQRKMYLENLELFAGAVHDFIKFIENGCKVGQQIKIYNQKLMNARRKTLREFEKVNIQPEDSKQERWASNLDRINGLIEPEVEKAIKLAEAGLEKLRKNSQNSAII